MERIVEITKSLRKNKKSEGKPLELIFPSLPVNSWKPLPEIPIERIGSGLNKKVRVYELSITENQRYLTTAYRINIASVTHISFIISHYFITTIFRCILYVTRLD